MLQLALLMFLCMNTPTLVVDSARILGIFPIPSISHQVVFRALMLELGKRGHELVIITPNPALPVDRPPDNITEIDTGEAYDLMAKLFKQARGSNNFKRGIVMDIQMLFTEDSAKGMMELISYQFNLAEVKALLRDKTQKFDLVFVEAISNFHLVVSHIFKAPAILFSSFYGCPEHFETMGAVTWHPLYYPNYFRHQYKNLTYWEKIHEFYLEWRLFWMIKTDQERENQLLKERFGPKVPTIKELHKNIQMLFVNAHPMFGNNRPVPPSVVYLGALHLQPAKQLPQELQTYLDDSAQGVVYCSLGSNVKPSMMDQDLLEAFLGAFEALPYNILWKYDGDEILNLPKNVKVKKWFPQRDILLHPKIKAFVTQGGLQSTDEAIDSEVPLVGIPMMADQWYNVDKYLDFGIGVQVNAVTMTAQDLVDAVNEVIDNVRYRKNIKRLRGIITDQPEEPLQRGVYWTEHVLRHGGGHLQSPTARTSWFEFLMVEIFAIVLTVVVVVVAIITYACCGIVGLCKRTLRAIKDKQC